MRIYSIFSSIDGEANAYHQGRIATFIRFAGCNLECTYCDTPYARSFTAGNEMSAEDVIREVRKYPSDKLTITGGEPLAQTDAVFELTRRLYRLDYKVSIETNGSYHPIGFGVGSWVVDYKLPSSGCQHFMVDTVFCALRRNDFVKFVIQTAEDFREANRKKLEFESKGCLAQFVYSPCDLDPSSLVKWIQVAGLSDVILNLQIHKIIWPDCGESDEK